MRMLLPGLLPRRPTLRAPTKGRRGFRPRVEELERREVPTVLPPVVISDPLGFRWLTEQCVVSSSHAPDTVTLDHGLVGTTGYATFDGGATRFSDSAYDGIKILGSADGLTTNIHSNVKPVLLLGDRDFDAVNIGDARNLVQGIQATLTVENPRFWNVVTVNDQGDTNFRTATIDVVTIDGKLYEQVTGLGASEMDFKCADTRGVTVRTGTGGAAVSVRGTYPFHEGGGTTLFGNGHNIDTVRVGSVGSTAGIQGPLTIENEPDYTAIDVDDSADTFFRDNVVLDLMPTGGDVFGRIVGLSLGTISYECADTRSVTVRTGAGGATVNVRGTFAFDGGGGTTLFGNASGTAPDAVNVGDHSLTTGIGGPLTIENEANGTFLNVDDSADTGFQNSVVLDTVLMAGRTFGQIGGLSQGLIAYDCADVSGVNVATGVGGAAVIVEDACVPTELFGNGTGDDTVWVKGTLESGKVTIDVGSDERVYIGGNDHTLSSILSTVQVNGNGTTRLYVMDNGNSSQETYTILDTNLSTTTHSIVDFTGIAQLWLYPSTNPLTSYDDSGCSMTKLYTFVYAVGLNPPI